jgi:integrase/recombinase XerC
VIGDFLNYLTYEKNVSVHTVEAYRSDLESFVTFLTDEYFTISRDQLDWTCVDHLTIRAYLAHLSRRKMSRASTARHLSALRSLF